MYGMVNSIITAVGVIMFLMKILGQARPLIWLVFCVCASVNSPPSSKMCHSTCTYKMLFVPSRQMDFVQRFTFDGHIKTYVHEPLPQTFYLPGLDWEQIFGCAFDSVS